MTNNNHNPGSSTTNAGGGREAHESDHLLAIPENRSLITNHHTIEDTEAQENDQLLGRSIDGEGGGREQQQQHRRTRSRGGGGHERQGSNISNILESIAEEIAVVAGDIQQATQQMVEDVREAVVEEIEQVTMAAAIEFDYEGTTVAPDQHDNDGDGGGCGSTAQQTTLAETEEYDQHTSKFYFLDMALTRNLSILPGDVVDASEYVAEAPSYVPIPNPDQDEDHEDEEDDGLSAQGTSGGVSGVRKPTDISRLTETEAGAFSRPEKKTDEPEATPISAYFLLLSAVVSLSSIGPILDLQGDEVTATMKVFWRTSATALALFPFASYSCYECGGFPKLDIRNWIMFVFAAGGYAGMCVFFVWSLKYTSIGNAVIFSNSQALILLVAKVFMGSHVTFLEASGATIAFGGALLCSKDSSESAPETFTESTGPAWKTTLFGDVLALASAFLGVTYLVLAKTIRSHTNLYFFMWFIMFVGSLETLLLAWIVGEHITIDFDVNTGVWGWMHPQFDRFPLEMVMVVVCNLFGAMGYVRAMHYFDNLVISVATLMEPVVAELMAVILGVGFLPGWLGWTGNALVAFGTLAVVYKPGGEGGGSLGH